MALFAISCSTNGTSPANGASEFRVVADGSYGGVAGAGEMTKASADFASDSAEFAARWKRIVGDTAPPAIDWKRETAIFLSLGSRSTGGHSVEALSVSFEGNDAQVATRIKSPGKGEMTSMAFTAPYVVIAVPRRDVGAVTWRRDDGEVVARVTRADRETPTQPEAQ